MRHALVRLGQRGAGSYGADPGMSTQPERQVILLPKNLAQAIEWVLGPSQGKAPDLSRLTSQQMQLLPLPVAQAFMDLTLAALQDPPRPARHALWRDARALQRARRQRQQASALTAARQRLQAWYAQTENARQK